MKQVSIKKNFIMNAILTMSSFVFPLITFPYVSRVLMEVGTGKVSFATSVISYFTMFAQLGIPVYGVRACAKVRDDKEKLSKTAQELLIINIFTSVLSYILLFIGILLIPKFQEEKTLILIISITIFLSAVGMEWLYKALEEYTFITVRSVIFKLIALIGMFLLVQDESDYLQYGAITIFAASASNVMNLLYARKFISFKKQGSYEFKKHFKPILIFFAMSCATTIYTHLDVLMLGFITSDAETGYYNAAVKVKGILVSVITSLGTVLFPRCAYYIEHKQMDEFRRVSQKALHFVLLASLPLTVYFVLFAKQCILFLAGPAFSESVLSMQIIMPTLLFIGISNITGIQMLIPLGKEKTVLFSEIFGVVIDLILNAIFIPQLGAAGAAIGTVAAELGVTLFQYFSMRQDIRAMLRAVSYWKIFLALVLGVAASCFVTYLEVSAFLTLLISAVLFFAVYLGILILLKENLTIEILNQEMNRFKKLLKKSKNKEEYL